MIDIKAPDAKNAIISGVEKGAISQKELYDLIQTTEVGFYSCELEIYDTEQTDLTRKGSIKLKVYKNKVEYNTATTRIEATTIESDHWLGFHMSKTEAKKEAVKLVKMGVAALNIQKKQERIEQWINQNQEYLK